MKNKIKTSIKTSIIVIFILLLTSFIYTKITKQKVFALTPAEATEQSQERPTGDSSWNTKKEENGAIERIASYEPEGSGRSAVPLVNYPGITKQTINGTEYVVITPNELHNIKSLFCCSKGTGLTTGYFTKESDRTCTPQEAWVLAEYEKNDYGSYASFTPQNTDVTTTVIEVRDSSGIREVDTVDVDGTPHTVVEYGGVGDEKYAWYDADNDKYYEVTAEAGSGYSFVQYAWWNVKSVGDNKVDVPANDFANEAKAFQAYVKNVNGSDSFEMTDSGYFKINYNVSSTPDSGDKMDVTFDAIENKYYIGPFTVNYPRYVTKQGDRAKVEFCGISATLLVGTDIEGNELLDSEGNSVLKLGENYRFIFESEEKHKDQFDPVDYYEDAEHTIESEYAKKYPAPNEKFYIEVNYLNDLAKIKNFKMQFFYKTSGGTYEYWTGNTLPPDDGNPDTVEDPGDGEEQQPQAKATGPHKVIEIDGNVGTGGTHSAEYGEGDRDLQPVELEFLTFDGPVDLTTRLSGFVWIDNDESKDPSSGKIGCYDGEGSKDVKAPKNSVEIKVWKVTYKKDGSNLTEEERELALAKTGDEIINFADDRLYIDDNGAYKIDEIVLPSIEGLDTSNYAVSYDVEFIYDGQTYEATEFLKSAGDDVTEIEDKIGKFKKTVDDTRGEGKDYETFKNDSYVVENAEERKKFDSYFTEVWGDTPVDKTTGQTNGKSTGGQNGGIYFDDLEPETPELVPDGETSLQYDSDFAVRENNGDVQIKQNADDAENDNTYVKLTSKLITHDEQGFIKEQYRFGARTSEPGFLLPYETMYHPEKGNYDNIKVFEKEFKPVDEYFNQINLGLLERYHTDISVEKDLYTAKALVNKQETTYTFNNLAPISEDALKQQLDLQYREQTYKIGLYNSDYYYRSSVYDSIEDTITKQVFQAYKQNTELRLFVTYKIGIYNGSELTNVSINEFTDYYDKTFTIVNKEQIKGDILDNEGNVHHDQVIAETPYFRKLKPSNEDTPAEELTDTYRYNKAEDLAASQIAKDSSGARITGDLKFDIEDDRHPVEASSGPDGFNYVVSDDLNALNEEKTGFNTNSLAPGEKMEVFVTYEVDLNGFEAAASESTTVENVPGVKEGENDQKVTSTPAERPDLLGNKCNIAELTKYSSTYTEDHVKRHNTTSYAEGQISGRIDRNSAPDNINMEGATRTNIDLKFLEDDTETAPVLTVELKSGDPRTIDGVAWEDGREDFEEADGIYDTTNEHGIENVDVTLVEKIKINPEDHISVTTDSGVTLEMLDYEFEYIWPDNSFADNEFKARTKTDSNGSYQFKDFVSGLYVVRFEYGNSVETLKYNGQDYKNTAYQTDMVNATPVSASDAAYGSTVTGIEEYNKPGKPTLNNEWHDLSSNDNAKALESTRLSDARDYEPRRIKVNTYSRTITNKNAEVLAAYVDDKDVNLTEEYKEILKNNQEQLIDNTAMVANTAKFNVEIEKQDTIAYKTVETTTGDQQNNRSDKPEVVSGTSHQYRIANIDFGLVKRPETRINIRSEINTLTLSKNDGTGAVLSVEFEDNGDIKKAEGNNSASISKITEIKKESLNDDAQGFKYIAIEASFLKGLTVQITYKITVENNSEIDYVGPELASRKYMGELYRLVADYEKDELNNAVPGVECFNTGEGIIYGRYLGLHYYTNKLPTADTEENYGFAYNDQVVKTTIDQLIDYVDNDLSIDKSLSENNFENNYWQDTSEQDRKNKLSQVAYVKNASGEYVKVETSLMDDKQRPYVNVTRDGDGNITDVTKNNLVVSGNENMSCHEDDIKYNKTAVDENRRPKYDVDETGKMVPVLTEVELKDVYTTIDESISSAQISERNPQLTTELIPAKTPEERKDGGVSIKETYVSTMAQANETAINTMNYDNLLEIVMYSNSVGRRDTEAIPGNANLISKQLPLYKAGYNYNYAAIDLEPDKRYQPKEAEVADTTAAGKTIIKTERDAYAPRDTVTFSEPTGLSLRAENINKAVKIILTSLIVAAVLIIATTVTVVVRKRKYDDEDILKTKNKK